MKSRSNIVQLKQFQVNEKKRRIDQLDAMIAEFERMAGELEAQVNSEEAKSGITDQSHFAYPTFAKAARTRCDNLRVSQEDLLQQREQLEQELSDVEAELRKAEALESRDGKVRGGEDSAHALSL